MKHLVRTALAFGIAVAGSTASPGWARAQEPAEARGPQTAPSAAPVADGLGQSQAPAPKDDRVERSAQKPVLDPDPKSAPAAKPDPKDVKKQVPPVPKVSTGEAVINLRKSIEDDEKQLKALAKEREDQDAEYKAAQADFVRVDALLDKDKKALKELGPDVDPAARKELTDKIGRIEKARTLYKDRFDLAIEDRKNSAEQITNLEQKLLRDRKALDKLEGKEVPVPAATPAVEGAPAVTPTPGATPTVAPAPAPMPAATAAPAAAPVATATPAPAPVTTPAPAPAAAAIPGAPALPTADATTAPAAAATATADAEKKGPVSEELLEAKEDVQTKAEASKEAEAEAKSVTERLESLDKEIALEQKMLATGRKQRENASARQVTTAEWFRRQSLEGAPREKLDTILAQLKAVEKQLGAANEDVLEHTTRLQELQGARADLQGEQINALHAAEEARAQVKIAESDVKRLENPLAVRNVLHWLIEHGLRLLAIVMAIFAGLWVSKIFSQRVIRLLAHSGARGSSVEREARARTLIGVFHNAASLSIMVGGGLMILQEAGIPIAPLLGGAAVFGLAVAFGAQNLIRDYFYGFVILLENQYKLNDVVQIGELSGQVENITLRMTVLRDLEGRVHFVPNGQITAVTNMTHGWSRALFAIGVAYKENVDRVMAVLMTLTQELRKDPVLGPMILEDATMLGVDELADSAVVIKFFIKTRPLQQWNVKRELLRRIKNRFDELGIEIPFPQRTVWHRVEPDSNLPEALSQPSQILHAGRPHRQSV